ncbi:hypothetical protein ACWJJH_07545 [Endozoicomonadaceae bacterium StTr2]
MYLDIEERFVDATTLITQHRPEEEWLLKGSASYDITAGMPEYERRQIELEAIAGRPWSGRRLSPRMPRHYFSGFALRADRRASSIIFAEGFRLQNRSSWNEASKARVAMAMGAALEDPYTYGEGISTTCRYSTANIYTRSNEGSIYLIDGRGIWGVIIEGLQRAGCPGRKKPPYEEINYLQDIPAHAVAGALEGKTRLQCNPAYYGVDCTGPGDFSKLKTFLKEGMPVREQLRLLVQSDIAETAF